jgi:GMP synthase (glutamine-hydrolysing)
MDIFGIINYEVETLGLFESEIKKRAHSLTMVHARKNPKSLSSLYDKDCIFIMGGPMSIRDLDNHGYLSEEINLCKYRIKNNLPTLGICLGAQILAFAGGSTIIKGSQPERGWVDIVLTPQGIRDPFFKDIEPGFKSFHWHDDTFSLPKEAIHLASSNNYSSQAFRIGDKCYGIQFHPEVGDDNIKRMIKKHRKVFDENISNYPLAITASKLAQHKLRAKILMANFLNLSFKTKRGWGNIS